MWPRGWLGKLFLYQPGLSLLEAKRYRTIARLSSATQPVWLSSAAMPTFVAPGAKQAGVFKQSARLHAFYSGIMALQWVFRRSSSRCFLSCGLLSATPRPHLHRTHLSVGMGLRRQHAGIYRSAAHLSPTLSTSRIFGQCVKRLLFLLLRCSLPSNASTKAAKATLSTRRRAVGIINNARAD